MLSLLVLFCVSVGVVGVRCWRCALLRYVVVAVNVIGAVCQCRLLASRFVVVVRRGCSSLVMSVC